MSGHVLAIQPAQAPSSVQMMTVQQQFPDQMQSGSFLLACINGNWPILSAVMGAVFAIAFFYGRYTVKEKYRDEAIRDLKEEVKQRNRQPQFRGASAPPVENVDLDDAVSVSDETPIPAPQKSKHTSTAPQQENRIQMDQQES